MNRCHYFILNVLLLRGFDFSLESLVIFSSTSSSASLNVCKSETIFFHSSIQHSRWIFIISLIYNSTSARCKGTERRRKKMFRKTRSSLRWGKACSFNPFIRCMMSCSSLIIQISSLKSSTCNLSDVKWWERAILEATEPETRRLLSIRRHHRAPTCDCEGKQLI